jgi:hypothetical protein
MFKRRVQLPLLLLVKARKLTSAHVQLISLQRVDDRFSRLILRSGEGKGQRRNEKR